jgi:hypothetical protein
MKKNFSDNFIALLAFVALLLAILLGWQSWNHARLKIEVAFSEEQTRVFEEMRLQAIQGSPSVAAESLEYVVNYYPSGTKQREGSRLDKVVERVRSSVIRDIISQLRQKSGEDLGEKPEAWIQKYANKK